MNECMLSYRDSCACNVLCRQELNNRHVQDICNITLNVSWGIVIMSILFYAKSVCACVGSYLNKVD